MLSKIDDIESDCLTAFILHAEVKPLMVAPGVGVDSHIEIILVFAQHRHHIEIPALEV